jgi:hypothetical protein
MRALIFFAAGIGVALLANGVLPLRPTVDGRLNVIEQLLFRQEQALSSLKSAMNEQKSRPFSSAPKEAPAPPPLPPPPRALIRPEEGPSWQNYRVQKGDTLWHVAQTRWGKGDYYPLLFEDNPQLEICLYPGQVLKVQTDPRRVRRLFQQLTFFNASRTLLYYRYRVRPGETWESISQRLYRHRQRAAQLMALNREQMLRENQRILVAFDH